MLPKGSGGVIEGPDARLDRLAALGVPIVTDYRSVRDALADPACFLQWDGAARTPGGVVQISMAGACERDWELVPSSSALIPEEGEGPYSFAQTALFLNPPEHTRFRRLVNDAWAGGRPIAELAPGIAQNARQLVRRAAQHGEVEFMRAVALPLSAMTLAAFFGDDEPEWWVERTVQQAEQMWGTRKLMDSAPFQTHVWDLIQARRGSSADDVISRMLAVRGSSGFGFRLNEVQTFVVQASFPNANVARLMGTLAHVLSTKPELRERVRQRPSSAPGLVSEVLRTLPPLEGVFRHTSRACSIGGYDLPAGHGLFASFARAHRDPLRFPEPDEFRLDRGGSKTHLAFGAGIHGCPASRLTMMQANVLTQVLCDLPVLRLAEDGVTNYRYGLFAGPSELNLEIEPV
jgi:cytochrome P450